MMLSTQTLDQQFAQFRLDDERRRQDDNHIAPPKASSTSTIHESKGGDTSSSRHPSAATATALALTTVTAALPAIIQQQQRLSVEREYAMEYSDESKSPRHSDNNNRKAMNSNNDHSLDDICDICDRNQREWELQVKAYHSAQLLGDPSSLKMVPPLSHPPAPPPHTHPTSRHGHGRAHGLSNSHSPRSLAVPSKSATTSGFTSGGNERQASNRGVLIHDGNDDSDDYSEHLQLPSTIPNINIGGSGSVKSNSKLMTENDAKQTAKRQPNVPLHASSASSTFDAERRSSHDSKRSSHASVLDDSLSERESDREQQQQQQASPRHHDNVDDASDNNNDHEDDHDYDYDHEADYDNGHDHDQQRSADELYDDDDDDHDTTQNDSHEHEDDDNDNVVLSARYALFLLSTDHN
jgi:hypothetical protein